MGYSKHKAHNYILSVSVFVYFIFIILEGKYDFTSILILSVIVIYFLGSLFYSVYSKIQGENKQKQKKEELIYFKSNASKVKVDLTKVRIKSNSWKNKQTIYKHEIYEEVIEKDVNTNFVELKVLIENRTFEYSFYISMDKQALEFKLGTQKSTFIYIDKNDKDNYYLDLEFLK